ncbi:MAG: hypothetical protein MUF58_12345 [Arcicella sp.]|jgi:hypothetical protein|nr:hypothetical protein [Arcicella sp.]
METLVTNLDDLVEYLSGVDREIRPKKAKPLKNYIKGYYEGIKHTEVNPYTVINEMENRNLIFVGLNGDIIYNF